MQAAKIVLRKQTQTREIKVTEGLTVGGKTISVLAGPCAVESQQQIDAVANSLTNRIHGLRGGAYKPRTSPYSFQGLGIKGLEILQSTAVREKLAVCTEAMSEDQLGEVATHADIVQIGSRNMQNFSLLKAAGRLNKPILLKRGLSATIEEFLMAAEYIASEGNHEIILCERGIRSYDSYTRNVLDLGAVVALKTLTDLPVIVDPSHAAGRRDLIEGLSKAAVAAGADGLIVECHPQPDESVSDAAQALSFDEMHALLDVVTPVAEAVGREMIDSKIELQESSVSRLHSC